MNFTPGGPSGSSATRRPVTRATVREHAAGRRGKFHLEAHQSRPAVLEYDPSGDFTAGLPLGRFEIAYGLKLGAWAPGTVFRYQGRLLTAGADGRARTADGQVVLLVRSLGY